MDDSTNPVQTTTGTTSQDDGDYKIPQLVKEKYPDLVELIKKTQSMMPEERQYWFQILPIMTDEQVARLRKILEDEAAQLAKLDAQYQEEVSRLNQKHLAEWENYDREQTEKEMKAKREERAKAEASAEAEESQTEEDLLSSLQKLGE